MLRSTRFDYDNNGVKHTSYSDSSEESSDSSLGDIPTEYNGRPVARVPKELGMKSLSSKIIIMHPSGIKLAKCGPGYLVLCSEEGCGYLGSKEGIKCVKHYMSYKHCRCAGCDKRAHYGLERHKPLYCAPHREPGMIDVVHNVCLADGCNLLAYFGLPGGKAQYCSNHKLAEMIDVLHKRCVFPGCNKSRTFGLEGGSVEYCAEHKPPDAINKKIRQCIAPGCNMERSFGFLGGEKLFCSIHKLPNMINFKTKKCAFIDCMTVPSFNFIGGSPIFCLRHKSDDMINVRNKRCIVSGCIITACFGFLEGKKEYCNSHKKEGMINLISRRCIIIGCTIHARYGFPDSVAEYCSEHKLLGMVNVRDKTCIHTDCKQRPSYNLLFSIGRIHCHEHRSMNEYLYEKCNPICYELGCHNKAVYFESDDTNIYPVRCYEHKHDFDIELVNRVCPNCEECVYYPINQEYCMECGQYRELVIYSVREAVVKYGLESSNIEFIHNKRVSRIGSRYRPDFLIHSVFGYIIIEVDENQHKHIFQSKEEKRMRRIYNDIQGIAPGKQVMFIRYNPDRFVGSRNVDEKERLSYLLIVLTNMLQLPNLGTALGYIKLFYDGFNGKPTIQPLNVAN